VDKDGVFIQEKGQSLPESYLQDIVQANGRTVFYQQRGRYYAGLLYPDETGNWLVIKSATNAYGSEVMMHLRNTLLITLLLAIVSIFLAGRYFSRKTFQPFRSITSRVQQISEGNLHLRLEKQENIDEISELVKTFNHMLDRLETTFETQQNFISNASHELRTPLTAIVAEADYALSRERHAEDYKQSLQHIGQQAEKLQHLIRGLLALAQTGFDGKKQLWETVRLDQLVFDVKANIDAMIPGNKVKVEMTDMPNQDTDICMTGNYELLKVALDNIVLNACKYSDNEEVKFSLSLADGQAILDISDHGIGIPEQELKHIYDPFYRASNAKSYSGYGIGMPLANNIIRLHKGNIEVHSKVDEGTRVKIILPLQENAA
jgi:signal transduction histidine kinase